MNTLQTAYINALLADASYVETIPKGDIQADKFKTRLTQTQANFLAANFTVLDSVETPRALGSGFDAVVWQIKSGSAAAGPNNAATPASDSDTAPGRTTCKLTKTRAINRMQTCANGIFDRKTNATRLGAMGRLS